MRGIMISFLRVSTWLYLKSFLEKYGGRCENSKDGWTYLSLSMIG